MLRSKIDIEFDRGQGHHIKTKLNEKVHLTAAAILRRKKKKGGVGLSIICIQQILMCPALLATETHLCNLHLVL